MFLTNAVHVTRAPARKFAGTDGAKRAPGGTVTQESHTVSNRELKPAAKEGEHHRQPCPKRVELLNGQGACNIFFSHKKLGN